MRFSPSIVVLFLTSVLGTCCGCGDGRPARVPVAGTVLIDGAPLRHGFIQVIPANGRVAQASIDSDGKFILSTFGDNDGCLPGTHKVAVIGLETKGPSSQMWHAPKKYMNPDTSDLTVTVDDSTKDITIELTWDGGKPFEEKFGAE